VIMAVVRGQLRYGWGGPRQVGQKGGPRRYGNTTYGDGYSLFKGRRDSSYGAIQSQFRIDWDAENYKRALDSVGINGDQYVRDLLKTYAEGAVHEARENLYDMAGALRREMIPATGARNIYSRVAMSLRVDEVPGSPALRIHTGDNIKQAPFGQIGSRGGFLSRIVSTGYGPYEYAKDLPALVKSSVSNYMKTGNTEGSSYGMSQKGVHPGMAGYDYMADIEENTIKDFEEGIKRDMEDFGRRYGFTPELGY